MTVANGGETRSLSALEVSLLCLGVSTFPDSLDALEMYSCAKTNYTVPLINPFPYFSPVSDDFSVDLFPGNILCSVWCASSRLCIN